MIIREYYLEPTKILFEISEYPPTEEKLDKIKCFKAFIEKNRGLFDLEKIDHTRSIPLDTQSLLNDENFSKGWPTFNTDLFERPDSTLHLLEYCLHEVCKNCII